MIRLSKHQLFTLIFVFEVGSTPIFALGIEAEQNAWIVVLLALLIGLFILWSYLELQKAFPTKGLVEIFTNILGKPLGLPLCILYAMGFIWGCGRNLREFIELIAMTVIPHTPLWIILFFFIGLSLYVSVKGFEVFARTTEFIFPTIIFFLIILFALISISGEVHFKNLTPILGDGLKPILKSLPGVVWFPFGEIYVFLMYWHYVNDINTIKKASFKAVILSGILLCFTTMINICTLGAKYTSIATIPLVETLRLINIGDIITHLDVIGVIIIFLGGFFKMTLYLNGIAIIINSVFSIKKSQLVLILTGIFMMYFSIYFEPSFAYHQWMFPFDARYYGLPFALIYPQLLLLIYILKKKRAEL